MSTRFRRCSARWRGAVALMALSGAARAEVPISEQASRHFKAGVRYLTTDDADRFDKAYSEFRAAYADSPSWKILGNLGIVAEALERDGEAIQAYRGYLDGGGKELRAAEREQFKADLARLEHSSALVSIRAQPDGAWIIDERSPAEGKPVINRYGPLSGTLELRLRPGRHRMHAELSGYGSDNWDYDARPGADGSHVFELHRANIPSETPPPARPEAFDDRLGGPDDHGAARIVGYGALGFGGAGAAIGTVFFLRALDRIREGDAAIGTCQKQASPPPVCWRAREKSEEEGVERTRSLVSFGVAGALITTGVLLLVYAGPPAPPSAERAALTPWLGPHQLGVAGRF